MTEIELSNMKLGKKLGVIEDPRTLRFRAFMPLTLPAPPRSSIYSAGNATWPLFRNDDFGCCAFAAQGHRVVLQERNVRQHEVALSDEDILAAYSAVTGFDRNRPETDNGTYMLDALNYQRTTGMGLENDGTSHTIDAFVKVDHNKPEEVRVASWMFGGLYLGIWLPKSAQHSGLWQVPDQGPVGDGEPGSWGGHAVWMNGYTSREVEIITWGRKQRLTWEFFAAYVDEAYPVISEDFLRADRSTTRGGFRVDQLNGYLHELAG